MEILLCVCIFSRRNENITSFSTRCDNINAIRIAYLYNCTKFIWSGMLKGYFWSTWNHGRLQSLFEWLKNQLLLDTVKVLTFFVCSLSTHTHKGRELCFGNFLIRISFCTESWNFPKFDLVYLNICSSKKGFNEITKPAVARGHTYLFQLKPNSFDQIGGARNANLSSLWNEAK